MRLDTTTEAAASQLAVSVELHPDEVADAMRSATRRIAPVWDLEDFVAVNPYLGLTDRPMATAAQQLSLLAGARTTVPVELVRTAIAERAGFVDELADALAKVAPGAHLDELLDRVERAERAGTRPAVRTVAEVASEVTGTDWSGWSTGRTTDWAAAYFDHGQAMWTSVDARRSPFDAWRWEASIDRTPSLYGLRGYRRRVRELPAMPVEAVRRCLVQLGLSERAVEEYLHALLLRVGGWSAHAARIVWDAELAGRGDDTLFELLAVLVAADALLLEELDDERVDAAWAEARRGIEAVAAGRAAGSDAAAWQLQEAFDLAEQRRWVQRLQGSATASVEGRARAQVVCCIDVRSEVLRRHLERVAPDVHTLGFAGFFGVPLQLRPLAHDHGVDQFPVLLTAGAVVAETASSPERHAEAVTRRNLAHQVRRAWKSFKMGAISCFSFVGPVGLAYLPKLFSDSFGRTRPVRPAEVEGLSAELAAELRPTLDAVEGQAGSGIPHEQRVALAEGALRGMSLTTGLAPLVVLAGHGASTTNNPYDNGLDCGACGGHTGESNARVTAMLLNDARVRADLAERGVHVPADTWFVAALHDTTTDEVRWFDTDRVPASHHEQLEQLQADLVGAGAGARAERAGRLGIVAGDDVDAAILARSADWAQVRPEWGLAGCAAFVAAPRAHTRGLDLGGRSFLHSYDWRADDAFAVLELIMTAPMVVASWISLQYYASTVDNERYGSGNKTLHNVVGKLGVLEGTAGDLRTGLPLQSVHDGVRYQHDPVRLNVVIAAPVPAMNDVLVAHPQVAQLVDHGWLHLLAMDDDGRVTQRYVGDLRWEPVGTD
jgi:uncharacterized protein YbcC (UPF0753/DUF2309 family)